MYAPQKWKADYAIVPHVKVNSYIYIYIIYKHVPEHIEI